MSLNFKFYIYYVDLKTILIVLIKFVWQKSPQLKVCFTLFVYTFECNSYLNVFIRFSVSSLYNFLCTKSESIRKIYKVERCTWKFYTFNSFIWWNKYRIRKYWNWQIILSKYNCTIFTLKILSKCYVLWRKKKR